MLTKTNWNDSLRSASSNRSNKKLYKNKNGYSILHKFNNILEMKSYERPTSTAINRRQKSLIMKITNNFNVII